MTRTTHFADSRVMATIRLRFTLAAIKLLVLLLIALVAPVVSADDAAVSGSGRIECRGGEWPAGAPIRLATGIGNT